MEALRNPKAGNTIPIVLVTTADAKKGLETIPYKTLSADTRKAARELRKTLEGVDVLGAGAPEEADSDSADPASDDSGSELLCESREWTNSSGNKMTAAVVAVNDTRVIFRMSGGKTVEYPLVKLSEESQEALKELKAE